MENLATANQIPSWWYFFRIIPRRLPGRTRLTRFLFGFLQSITKQHSYKCCSNSLFFCLPSLEEPVAVSLVLDGNYEPLLSECIRKSLPFNGIFIDVGANIGCHSMPACRYLGGKGLVIAIEASPTIYNHLEAGISDNKLSSIISVNCLAGERDESAVPYFDAPRSKFGMGSRSPSRFGHENPVSVAMVKLDTLAAKLSLDRVDCIKVDVEGYEQQVFQGASKILMQYKPVVFFEFCDWSENRPSENSKPGDAQRYLMALGYNIFLLKSWIENKSPLAKVLEEGSADLVAMCKRQ